MFPNANCTKQTRTDEWAVTNNHTLLRHSRAVCPGAKALIRINIGLFQNSGQGERKFRQNVLIKHQGSVGGSPSLLREAA